MSESFVDIRRSLCSYGNYRNKARTSTRYNNVAGTSLNLIDNVEVCDRPTAAATRLRQTDADTHAHSG